VFCGSREPLEKRITPLREPVFELFCAIALAACPRFLTIQVSAIFARVRVLHAEKFEVFFPVGAFLREWRVAEANFHPADRAIATQPGVFHVLEIFIASDGTMPQRPFVDGAR
jgi:hypothetical protein